MALSSPSSYRSSLFPAPPPSAGPPVPRPSRRGRSLRLVQFRREESSATVQGESAPAPLPRTDAPPQPHSLGVAGRRSRDPRVLGVPRSRSGSPHFPLDSHVRVAGYSTPTKATPEGRRCTMAAAPRGVAGRPNPGSLRPRRKANSYHLWIATFGNTAQQLTDPNAVSRKSGDPG
jgi:hypothetical protein